MTLYPANMIIAEDSTRIYMAPHTLRVEFSSWHPGKGAARSQGGQEIWTSSTQKRPERPTSSPLQAALGMVREGFALAAAGIASYDPVFDPDGRVLAVALA